MTFPLRVRRRPSGFWVVAGVLGMAVGASAAFGAIFHALVLDPIPVPNPERLLSFGGLAYGAGLGDPVAYWSQAEGLDTLALLRSGDIGEWEPGDGRWARVAEISGDFFRVFRIQSLESQDVVEIR